MSLQPPEAMQPSSRVALVLGFGSLLVIIGLAGARDFHTLQQYRQQEDGIRRLFLSRNRILSEIRSEVYLSGTYVRDYLLDPNPGRAAGFGKSLAEVHAQMEGDLDSYAGLLEPVESADYAQLKSELGRYWAAIDPLLAWDAAKRHTDGYAFLRDEIFPRRAATLEIAERIASLNEQQLTIGNQLAETLLSEVQTRLSVTLVSALLLGLGMAIFAARRILLLEARARARFLEVADARSHLAQLSARLVEVQEEERKSLSRELHDQIAQTLSAVLIETRNLLAGLGHWSEEKTRQHVECMKTLAESAAREVRNMALLLRPSMLDDLGLIPALKWHAREVTKRTSLDITVDADIESDQLPEEYKICIYRIVQEALHNCARHAQARVVQVRVTQQPDSLVLTVKDDGRGFDTQHAKGMGLLGIDERTTQLGGIYQITSRPGQGTLLKVELPFRAKGYARRDDEIEANFHSSGG